MKWEWNMGYERKLNGNNTKEVEDHRKDIEANLYELKTPED